MMARFSNLLNRSRMRMRFVTSIVGAALLMMTGATGLSLGQQAVASNGPSEPLKAYLRSYLSLGGKVPPDATTRVSAFSVKTDAR